MNQTEKAMAPLRLLQSTEKKEQQQAYDLGLIPEDMLTPNPEKASAEDVQRAVQAGKYPLYYFKQGLIPGIKPFELYKACDLEKGFLFDEENIIYSHNGKICYGLRLPYIDEKDYGMTPQHINLRNEVEVIASHAFAFCSTIESITFPTQKYITIEDGAFYHASSLHSLHGLYAEYIGREAFSGCKQLEVFVAPLLLKVIESGAFQESGIRVLQLSVHYDTVHAHTFKDCKQLEAITLTSHVEAVDHSAFEGCDALKAIYLDNEKQLHFFPEHLRKLCILPAPKASKEQEDDEDED